MTLALSYLKLLLFSPTVKAGGGCNDIIIIIIKYCVVPLRFGDVASRNDAARLMCHQSADFPVSRISYNQAVDFNPSTWRIYCFFSLYDKIFIAI